MRKLKTIDEAEEATRELRRAHDRKREALWKTLHKCDYCGMLDQSVDNYSFNEDATEKEPFVVDTPHVACIRSKNLESRVAELERTVDNIGQFLKPFAQTIRKVMRFVRRR